MTKTVYHYHADTHELLGQSEVEESPLEPGVYYAPANATTDEPPAVDAASQVAVYQPAYWPTGIAKDSGGTWTIQPINQGEGA